MNCTGAKCHTAKKGKGIACNEFIKLPEKRRPLRKAQPGMPPRARKSQPKSLQCQPNISIIPGNRYIYKKDVDENVCERTRYQKQTFTVPNMRAVLKKASWGTRRIFRGTRCSKQASTVRKRYSVPKTGFCGTRRSFRGVPCQKQPPAAPDASSVRETSPARR